MKKVEKSFEDIDYLSSIGLVEDARRMLDDIQKSYEEFRGKKFDEKNLKFANCQLKYLNALINSYRVKLQHFKLTDINSKLQAIKDLKSQGRK